MTLPTPYYAAQGVTVFRGDCLDVLAEMDPESVDALVTDPPYALGFMGEKWDRIGDTGRGSRARQERADEVTPTGQGHSTSAGPYLAGGVDSLRSAGRPFQAWCEQWAREVLRVLKPGGHMLAMGGTRTFHRLTCGIEDAGFEVRDCLMWLYGQGLPKSLDASKAIDKMHGAERDVTGTARGHVPTEGGTFDDDAYEWQPTYERRDVPVTEDAKRWDGWGTALKPAWESIVLARKPLTGTVARNVLEHGTGALNIDACRTMHHEPPGKPSVGMHGRRGGIMGETVERVRETTAASVSGRWPANVVLDERAAELLDAQSGTIPPSHRTTRTPDHEAGQIGWRRGSGDGFTDSGGASRFFYTSKASRHDRGAGNHHPTVKPVDLCRWLVRLVTPPGGTVLDPFAGSGTTGVACIIEGFGCILVEREAEYVAIIRERLSQPIEPVLDFTGGDAA